MNPEEARQRLKAIAEEQQRITASQSSTIQDLKRWDDLQAEFTDLEATLRETVDRNVRFLPGGNEPSMRTGGSPDSNVLTRSQSVASWIRSHKPNDQAAKLSIGKYVRGIVTGHWDNADEERALSAVSGSAGGYLVPQALSGDVIDLARAQTRVFQAGALTYPMETSQVNFAKVMSDPTGGWRGEGQDIPVGTIALGSTNLVARTLACIVRFSRELAEDASNLDNLVRSTLAEVFAGELDRVAIRGSGNGSEPLGLVNWPGYDAESMGDNGAALADYDKVLDAIGNVQGHNYEPNAYILAPRTNIEMAKLKDGEDRPLPLPPGLSDITKLVTNQLPVDQTHGNASTASEIILGQWDQLLIGIRTEIGIELLKERYADTGEYAALAWMRADILPLRIEAFSGVQGIIPPS